MLTYEDEPTIRNALEKRLESEPGVKSVDIHIKNRPHDDPPHIRVSVQTKLYLVPKIVKSRFDLPSEFDYWQLHNELDEIAESYKEVCSFLRKGFPPEGVEVELGGRGVRGNWKTHA